jgi:NAD(P)-dependent dehydrogenase (short-subunit alcohol dehydrogenase family)
MELHSKYIVCGGANRGIGEAISRHLLAAGGQITIGFSPDNADNAQNLRAEFKNASFVEIDYTDKNSLANFVQEIDGEVDGFVFADMYFAMEQPEDFDFKTWDTSIAINLSAPNYLIHALKPKLREGASIVIITSTEAFIGSFGASAYAATKAAIHNLVKTHANNLGNKGIRVNALAAGWIGGVMDTDEVFNMSRRITPLGRLGKPEEVAAAANFLLSNDASFVNGSVLVVDGGYTGVDTIAKFEFEASKSS